MSIFSCIGSAQNSFWDIIQTRSDESFGTLKSKLNNEVFIVGGGSSKRPNKCLSRIQSQWISIWIRSARRERTNFHTWPTGINLLSPLNSEVTLQTPTNNIKQPLTCQSSKSILYIRLLHLPRNSTLATSRDLAFGISKLSSLTVNAMTVTVVVIESFKICLLPKPLVSENLLLGNYNLVLSDIY